MTDVVARADEWAEEVESLSQPEYSYEDGWITVNKLASMSNRSRSSVERVLREGVTEGKYVFAEGPYRQSDGRVSVRKVYRNVVSEG